MEQKEGIITAYSEAVAAGTFEAREPEWLERPHLRLAPEVVAVPDQPQEQLARQQAERIFRTAAAVGSVAVAETVSIEEPRYPTLLQAVKAAAEGDPVARKMVEANVGTDVIERTIKAGVVMEVGLEVGEDGRVSQFNQTMDEVFVNGLRYASGSRQMRGRAEAETRNGMRMGINLRMGNLEDNCFVVISRPDDEMTKEDMRKCGFFTDTMSTAIQVIRFKDGKLVQESAFVAGVTEPDGERQDAAAVIAMGKRFGVDFSGMSSTEILDTPLLVPNEMMPNGVVDLVKLYDQHGGTFFGQDQPAEDYVQYLEFCRQREASMQPTVQKIVDDLLKEADALRSPTDATKRLHKLSGKHMVEFAIANETIDARVFGEESAAFIAVARVAYRSGDMERYEEYKQQAQASDQSNSCPFASDGEGEGEGGGSTAGGNVSSQAASAGGSSRAESKNWKTKKGRCVVKTCPTRKQAVQVEVGPCGVCMDRCQEMFNAGIDPTASMFIVESRPREESPAEPVVYIPEKGVMARWFGYVEAEAPETAVVEEPVAA